MRYNCNHGRRSIRLKNYDYSKNGMYFITICTQNREKIFGEIIDENMILNDVGKMVEDEWKKLETEDIDVSKYCLMPNHFHGIIEIRVNVGVIHELPLRENKEDIKLRRKMMIPKLIGKFKMLSARRINILNNNVGKVWQRNYYEHIIRDEKDYVRISDYIKNNPRNWKEDRFN
ncbi:MAG: transposase [Psychrilyobacter sp.]|uniref:transposase n=1 Tax=Psychrilyobacter sp. TaxID=2586924 RepID=UPI003C71ABA4